MKKNLFQNKTSIMGINVTPIIDVALVLVIILMITTPIMTISDLTVHLPAAHVRSAEEGERLNITMSPGGDLAVDKQIIPPEDLVGMLRNRLEQPGQKDLMVIVRADGQISHQAVRGVLKKARQAGAHRLAIATTRQGSGKGNGSQEFPWTP